MPRFNVAVWLIASPQLILTLSPAPVTLPETAKLIPHLGFEAIELIVMVAHEMLLMVPDPVTGLPENVEPH